MSVPCTPASNALLGEICLVGAGPGAADLITVRGRELLSRAGAILYAGSLVSTDHLAYARADCQIADSSTMTLEEMVDWLLTAARRHPLVVRLQTGDPSLYGAMAELLPPLQQAGASTRVIPGVPSFAASAAAAQTTLTLPEVCQTVILTRVAGRTPMPEREQLQDLARHHCTLCLHLSITLWPTIERELSAAGWSADSPVVVVHKASWPGQEQILRGTLATMAALCQQADIHSQSMILIGPTLQPQPLPTRSQLYHPAFGHGFRAATPHEEV
ncbi:MAG: precorrin-4 C(11)-methyltransferase [Magnetococcales bacterium]|nr:precorrin-4 C(11)-methyltransferase [Magnetococcales bacterium]